MRWFWASASLKRSKGFELIQQVVWTLGVKREKIKFPFIRALEGNLDIGKSKDECED